MFHQIVLLRLVTILSVVYQQRKVNKPVVLSEMAFSVSLFFHYCHPRLFYKSDQNLVFQHVPYKVQIHNGCRVTFTTSFYSFGGETRTGSTIRFVLVCRLQIPILDLSWLYLSDSWYNFTPTMFIVFDESLLVNCTKNVQICQLYIREC